MFLAVRLCRDASAVESEHTSVRRNYTFTKGRDMGHTKSKTGMASLVGRPLLAGALAAAAVAPAAAADVFLKLDGIDGESTDSKHKGEIELISYAQSFTNSASISGGGGSTGKTTCGAVTVLK